MVLKRENSSKLNVSVNFVIVSVKIESLGQFAVIIMNMNTAVEIAEHAQTRLNLLIFLKNCNFRSIYSDNSEYDGKTSTK